MDGTLHVGAWDWVGLNPGRSSGTGPNQQQAEIQDGWMDEVKVFGRLGRLCCSGSDRPLVVALSEAIRCGCPAHEAIGTVALEPKLVRVAIYFHVDFPANVRGGLLLPTRSYTSPHGTRSVPEHANRRVQGWLLECRILHTQYEVHRQLEPTADSQQPHPLRDPPFIYSPNGLGWGCQTRAFRDVFR
ncbi:hypothetical protein BGZ61DRAFT_472530 [Ilyonectria robusta]|uniref:uncharacterized protein n=1 Tax=Ilyonectria robusta TaxID=1079257 RepID=UPI001E8ED252|nr:uncharacterized protein BGZ61DRAFT_472530 [Ilyonectria robusta]KAH8736177.1 hypothetical protein BGZ61DRAFT_472530 [Ilyonectria robusta]